VAIFPSATDPPVDAPPVDAPPNPLSLGVFEPGGVVAGEGIAEGQIFVSNLFFGGVRVVDTETGEIRVLVGNDIYMQRLAYGMEYYEPSNALFVSGAEHNLSENKYVGEIRIYDVSSGDLLSTCTDESSFPTDVAFVGDYAYATNSANNTILRLDIESALSGCCTFEIIPLPESFAPCDDSVDGEFVQGIAGYEGGIAFIASDNGKTGLYFMDPETLDITMLAEAPELGGDLLVFGQHLYMSDSEVNEIAVFALSSVNGTISATRVDTLKSEYYQGPTYLTLFQDQFLYSVNSISTDTGEDFDEYSAVFSPIGKVDPEPITLLSEIPLGLMHPGGIVAASSGSVLYVTNLFFGGVRVVDLTTGELFVLHPNSRYLAKTVYGLDLEEETETLFIAGTELVGNLLEGRIYVLDATSGEEIVACSIDEDFYPTDIAIVGDKAYATNSLGSNLVSISVSAAVNGTCETEILDLPVEVFNFTLFDIETILGMCCFFDDLFLAMA
jgi:WD40 repeat protein